MPKAAPLKPPVGGTVLIDSRRRTACLRLRPREGFEDAVLGVEIVGVDENGERFANTDWPLRLSFPVFVLNALEYFGGAGKAGPAASVQPGQMVDAAQRRQPPIRCKCARPAAS